MNMIEGQALNMMKLSVLVDNYVHELISTGVRVNRDGVDLEIKATPYSTLTVMSTLNGFGINVEDSIMSIQDEKIFVAFSKINHERCLIKISIKKYTHDENVVTEGTLR